MTAPMSEITVPVLLIIYNRPDLTQKSLDAIARVRPRTLLVAADGPRTPEDSPLCERARDLIDQLDWDCDVRKNYSHENLGCGVRVYSAIDWALDEFQEVIILEDDCVAEFSFFGYCQELLMYYKDDRRVMHISGNNFQNEVSEQQYSYYFSKYTHAWGWATWRRAWEHFDWRMARWPECRDTGVLEYWCSDPLEQRYWTQIFESMHGGRRDVWDYQWNFACWSQNGLAILPSVNLVSNTGFGSDATHTKSRSWFLERRTHDIGPIKHPPCMYRNVLADAFTFDNNFGGASMRRSTPWRSKILLATRLVSFPYRVLRKMYRLVSNRVADFCRS